MIPSDSGFHRPLKLARTIVHLAAGAKTEAAHSLNAPCYKLRVFVGKDWWPLH